MKNLVIAIVAVLGLSTAAMAEENKADVATFDKAFTDAFAQFFKPVATTQVPTGQIQLNTPAAYAQFMNPNVNRRTDQYGGSLDNRLRFMREAIAAVRAQVPESFRRGDASARRAFDQPGLEKKRLICILHGLRLLTDRNRQCGQPDRPATSAQ